MIAISYHTVYCTLGSLTKQKRHSTVVVLLLLKKRAEGIHLILANSRYEYDAHSNDKDNAFFQHYYRL